MATRQKATWSLPPPPPPQAGGSFQALEKMPPGRPPKRPSDGVNSSMDNASGASKTKLPRVERGPEDFSKVVQTKLQSYTRTGQACDRCKVRAFACVCVCVMLCLVFCVYFIFISIPFPSRCLHISYSHCLASLCCAQKKKKYGREHKTVLSQPDGHCQRAI